MGNTTSVSVAEASGGVQSVDRAITVLEILARRGEARVTEVAGELGVHKSTAFRLLAALESAAWWSRTATGAGTGWASAWSRWPAR